MNNIADRQTCRRVATALLALLCAAGAQAVTLTGPSAYKGQDVLTNNFDSGSSQTQNPWIGAVKLSADGSSPFWAYCIDPKTSSGFPSSAYASATLDSFLSTTLGNGKTGYEQQFQNGGGGDNSAYVGLDYKLQDPLRVRNNLVELFSHAYADSLTSNTKAAAFGYVVWEIMGDSATDGTYASNSGRADGSSSSGDALRTWGSSTWNSADSLDTQIDAYLTALNTNVWSSVNGANLGSAANYVYTVYFDQDPHQYQNFIKVTDAPPGGGGGTVPEPTSLALVAVALAGACRVRRRQAKG